MDLQDFEKDPRLFLFTSLTAGSSHIITATSRLETILKANKIPFQAIDIATDEKARRLWQRRAQKKKLPGLVKDGFVIGDLDEVEEWNEFGELKENIGPVPTSNAVPIGGRQGVNIRPLAPETSSPTTTRTSAPDLRAGATSPTTASALTDEHSRIALPGAAEIAARNKPHSPTSPASKQQPLAQTLSPTDENAKPSVTELPTSEEAPFSKDTSAASSQPLSNTATSKSEGDAVQSETESPAVAESIEPESESKAAPLQADHEHDDQAAITGPSEGHETAEVSQRVQHLTFQEPEDKHPNVDDEASAAAGDATNTVGD